MATYRTRTLLSATTLFLALMTTTMLAQAPRQMSYQGVLTSGGTRMNGAHILALKIYNAGGTALFTETQNVNVVDGIFNVIIGSVSPIPGSMTFNEPYYLGISVDGNPELAPRTPLVAAPYALNIPAPTTVNSVSGDVILQGGGSTTVNRVGNTITISSSGGSGGSGIQGVQSSDGSLQVTNPNGPTADLVLADGAVSTSKIAGGAVTNAKIANAAVTNDKISGTGASNGQVLTYNGANVVWSAPSSFTLPYTNTVNSATDLFALTNSGTARAGYFRNSNTAPTVSALYGEANATSPSLTIAGVEGKSTNGFGVIGRGGATSSGIFGLVITGPTAGAFYAGTGVTGFSDNGHGVAGITYQAASFGVYGTANGTGTGVRGTSTLGKAGSFEITNNANANNAAEGVTNGAGSGVYGSNTAATGSTAGVLGEASSASHGIGATGGVTGVFGRVTPTTPGGYSAGVRGVNNGTGGTGIGVIGYQGGSGWGVYGETPSGFGVYGLTTNNSAVSSGVRGETFSTNGIGVEAKYSGTGVGVALELDNGALRVAGVNKAAFVHTATVANKLSANGTDVDNPLCNGDATCILIVTQKLNPSGIVYNNSPIGVYYNTIRNKWEIFNENNVAIPTNAQFNVFVIKQ